MTIGQLLMAIMTVLITVFSGWSLWQGLSPYTFSKRNENPKLYWFDVITTALIITGCVAIAFLGF